MKIILIFSASLAISLSAFADVKGHEVKTLDCHASPSSRGTGTSYILYKKYAGLNSKHLAEMQDIQVVVGNMNGSGLVIEKFKLIGVDKSEFDGRILLVGQHKADSGKNIRIILRPKFDNNQQPIPFYYSGMITSEDNGYDRTISAYGLNCWTSDGEAN